MSLDDIKARLALGGVRVNERMTIGMGNDVKRELTKTTEEVITLTGDQVREAILIYVGRVDRSHLAKFDLWDARDEHTDVSMARITITETSKEG